MPKSGERIVKMGTSINILDPESGEYYVYQEGQVVPSEHVELVNHDLAWMTEEDVDTQEKLLRYAALANTNDPEGDEFVPKNEDDLDDMKVAELRDYAQEHNIDLADANTKKEIIEVIRAAEAV